MTMNHQENTLPVPAPTTLSPHKKQLLIIGIIGALGIIVAGVLYWFFFQKKELPPLTSSEKEIIIKDLNTAYEEAPLSPQSRTQMIMGTTPSSQKAR